MTERRYFQVIRVYPKAQGQQYYSWRDHSSEFLPMDDWTNWHLQRIDTKSRYNSQDTIISRIKEPLDVYLRKNLIITAYQDPDSGEWIRKTEVTDVVEDFHKFSRKYEDAIQKLELEFDNSLNKNTEQWNKLQADKLKAEEDINKEFTEYLTSKYTKFNYEEVRVRE